MASLVEEAIRGDPDWQAGMRCEFSGPGHPEATVGDHVDEVLANVAEEDAALQPDLRVIALVHDAFKQDVRWWIPGRGDHARLAERFARRHVSDPGVLKVIRRHDDAYRAWRSRFRSEAKAKRLIADLGDDLDLYLAFYRCDNATGDKSPEPLRWFQGVAGAVAPPP